VRQVGVEEGRGPDRVGVPEDPLRSFACVEQRMALIDRNLKFLARSKGKAYRGLR
jgi:hypothetical protein